MGRLAINESMTSNTFPSPLAESYAESLAERANQDIAILISKSVEYTKIEAAIAAGGGEVLEKQWLFDVFEGTNIPAGKHSLGIGPQFRKHGNFTDEEANQVRGQN